jgi:hypothetical protein
VALNQPPTSPAVRGANVIWALGIVALAGVILGLSIDEDGRNAWDSVHAWGAVAIVGAVATLAPVLGLSLGRSAERLAMVAACGAGALVLFWVLFTLPAVGSNTSLLVTVGVAAGIIAAWIGAPRPVGAPRRTW